MNIKTTIILAVLLIAFLLNACKKHDSNNESEVFSGEQKISKIEESFKLIKSEISHAGVEENLLYDYLLDQEEIIDSLIIAIKTDEHHSEGLYEFEIFLQKNECIQLINSLRKELELIQFNDSLKNVEVKIINVQDFGALGDGVNDDREAILEAIEAAKSLNKPSRIYFPAGVYAIDGPTEREDYSNIIITDLDNCVFEGDKDGVLLLMKTFGTGLNIRRCNNLIFQNIMIDYDPLPFTQGEIIHVDRDKDLVEIKIANGFPRPEDEKFKQARYLRGTMNHPESGKMLYEAGDWRVTDVVELSNGNFQFGVLSNEGFNQKGLTENLKAGYMFVMHAREAPHGGTAIMLNGSAYITFYQVNVYASPEHIAAVMYSDAIKFIEFKAEPKPGTDRLTCSNADGFHCRSNRKGPYIKDSKLFRINDDDTNIFGKMFPVAKTIGPREFIINDTGFEFVNGKVHSSVYRKGDLLGFVNLNDGFSIDRFARVEAVDSAGWKGRRWIKVILDRPVYGIFSRDSLGKEPYVSREYVNVQQPFAEHFLANLDTKGNGFVIKNNSFGDHRASSIKIQSTNGIIEGNHIKSVKGQGFFFGALMNWLELYPPRNIYIRNNIIDNHKGFGVVVSSPTTAQPENIMPLRRIYIQNNEFRNATDHGISLNNARDIFIENNFIESDIPIAYTLECSNIIQINNSIKPIEQ